MRRLKKFLAGWGIEEQILDFDGRTEAAACLLDIRRLATADVHARAQVIPGLTGQHREP